MKLEIVLNASVGSMLPMPSGFSGRYCWSVTIVHVASHMNTFETSSDTEYRFQSCWLVRIDAGQPQNQPLDRDEDGIQPRALPGEHLEHVGAEQCARGDGEQNRECDGDVFGGHGSAQNFSGRSIA